MSGEEAFGTVAEVAIAFLGFTGVIGVFSRRTFPPAVLVRLWVMVEFGLGSGWKRGRPSGPGA